MKKPMTEKAAQQLLDELTVRMTKRSFLMLEKSRLKNNGKMFAASIVSENFQQVAFAHCDNLDELALSKRVLETLLEEHYQQYKERLENGMKTKIAF